MLKEKEVPGGGSPDAEVKVGSYSAENISSLWGSIVLSHWLNKCAEHAVLGMEDAGQ